jgi:parallel beta-helix repeat protein
MTIELNPIASGYSTTKINANFDKVEAEFNTNVLRRNGLAVGEANQMEVPLDMNSFDILNVNNLDAQGFSLKGQSVESFVQTAEEAATAASLSETNAGVSETNAAASAVRAEVAADSSDAVILRADLAEAVDPLKGTAIVARSAQVVSSVAGLRLLNKTASSSRAFVSGYYVQGDGGGGLYYLDLADTASADNLGTIIVAADGGRWKLVNSETVVVEVFGAKGDNTTNDSPSIQAALNYCALSGKPLVFSSRTYLLGSHVGLYTGSKLIGNNSKIHIPANCNLTGAPDYGGIPRAIHNSVGITNVQLSGLDFYSDGEAGTFGAIAPTIALIGIVGLQIRNCKFRSFGKTGVYAQGLITFGCSKVIIDSCEFTECSGDGAACAEGGEGVVFSNNIASNNKDWGFALSNGVTDAKVIGNTFEFNLSTATGADECNQVSFIGNRSFGNEHGVRLARFVGPFVGTQFDSVISGNISTADGFGVSVESSSFFSVVGNTIRAATNQGIRIAASSSGVVSANAVRGSGAENILLDGGSGEIVVSSNVLTFGTYGIRQIGAAGSPHIVSTDNLISSASVSLVLGITYKTDSLGIAPDGKPFLNGVLAVTSDIASFTASEGGIVIPGNIWGYLPIKVGNEIKKMPLYNN